MQSSFFFFAVPKTTERGQLDGIHLQRDVVVVAFFPRIF